MTTMRELRGVVPEDLTSTYAESVNKNGVVKTLKESNNTDNSAELQVSLQAGSRPTCNSLLIFHTPTPPLHTTIA